MIEFLSAALSFPAVVFTVLLVLALLYWGLVIVGGLGIDALDGMDGATDGAVDGAADGAVDGAADGAIESAGLGILGSLIGLVQVRGVPVTVVLTFAAFYGWLVAQAGMLFVVMGASFDSGLTRGALFVAAVILSVPLANLSARPLSKLADDGTAMHRKDLIGKVVKVDTSRVDTRFGTAQYDDGAGGLTIHVRCDAEDNGLQRGSEALVLAWDEARGAYEVTPLDGLVPARQDDVPPSPT